MDLPKGLESVPSPGLLFDADAIDRNLQRMLDQVNRDPTRLRPHIKTHKCGAILDRMKDLGILSVKCATLAEADLAGRHGIPDILIAYPLVGPQIDQLAMLIDRWRESRFSVVIDSEPGLRELEKRLSPGDIDAFLDLDVGMHRTGISMEAGAADLAEKIAASDTLRFVGVHAYDGHIHAAELTTRRREFDASMVVLDSFLAAVPSLAKETTHGWRIVSGGTPTFPFHAERAIRSAGSWQCSPGTPVLWDAGYGTNYPDLSYEPAALLLCRVISHPGTGLACLDLGHKAVSAENPINRRVCFPTLREAEFVSQSEEHLVIRLPEEQRPEIGATVPGIPYHVCPSVALYDEATVIRAGTVSGESWAIEARRRGV